MGPAAEGGAGPSSRSRELRAAKAEVLRDIQTRVAGLTVSGSPARIRRSTDALKVEVDLPGGALGLMFVQTYKLGLPVGEFALGPIVQVKGGVVRRVLDAARLPPVHLDRLDASISATPEILPGEREHYRAGAARSAERVARVLSVEFPTILRAFTGDWDRVIGIARDHPQVVCHPKATALAAAALAGGSRVGEVLAMESSGGWWAADDRIDDLPERIASAVADTVARESLP